jgi:hypothetical protein
LTAVRRAIVAAASAASFAFTCAKLFAYRANVMATAAIPPDWITSNSDQP